MKKLLGILKDFWPIVILLLLVGVFFARTLFLGELYVTPNLGVGEITTGGLPLRWYLSEQLKAGHLPLWTDSLYGGYPLLAETTIAALYPVNLLLYWLLPPILAFHVDLAFGFLLAGLATYFYCRMVGLSRSGSMLSALAFTFSGYLVTHIAQIISIDSMVWFPLELILIEKLVRKADPKYVIALGVVFSFQLLAGQAQFFLYSVFVCLVYVVFRTWFSGMKQKPSVFAIAAFPLALILAMGLSAVQILPTLEYVSQSERAAGLRPEAINEHPFHLQELVTFVWPNYYGTSVTFTHNPPFEAKGIYWENIVYVGIAALFLAFVSLSKVRNSHQVFFYFLLIMSLILAAGGVGPLKGFLLLPPFHFFRIPARFLYFTTFSFAVLSGFGLDNLLEKFSGKRRIITAIFLSVTVADLFHYGFSFNRTYAAREWLKEPETVKILKQDASFFRILNVGLMQENEENVYFQARKKERGWSGDLGSYRHLLNWVMPKTNLYYGLNQASGVMAFRLQRTSELDDLLASILYGEGEPKKFDATRVRLLNLLGVKYLVSPFAIDEEALDLVGTTAKEISPVFRVYANREVLPNAFLVYRSRAFADGAQVLSELLSQDFDPIETVLLEGEAIPLESDADRGMEEGDAIGEIERRKAGREIAMTVRIGRPAMLVLTDTYYPGWRAYVDGREERIFRADYLFRAVRLSEGEHDVVFRYEPTSFRWGLWVTVGTAVAMAIGTVVLVMAGTRGKRKGGSLGKVEGGD